MLSRTASVSLAHLWNADLQVRSSFMMRTWRSALPMSERDARGPEEYDLGYLTNAEFI